MKPEEFRQFARQGYNLVPLSLEVLADLDTPVSTYMKLAQQDSYSFLLESVQGGEQWGRYSIIGLAAQQRLEVWGNTFKIFANNELLSSEEVADPIAAIEDYKNQFKVAPIEGLPRFTGGLVGYFGHSTINYIYPDLNPEPTAGLDVPDVLLMLAKELVIFDNLTGKLLLITHVNPQETNALEIGKQRLKEIKHRLATSNLSGVLNQTTTDQPLAEPNLSFAKNDFLQAITHLQEKIAAKEVEQVVISQRRSLKLTTSPMQIYRALRCLNPSPYMYHLNFGGFYIVGSSPEILARVQEGEITLRPIAGTRKRGTTPAEDAALEAELLADVKENSEHEMLITLNEEDLKPLSQAGSIKLTATKIVEKYSHVMHLVSNLTGQLKPELTPLDVLKTTFPAGTLSGAPRRRALELLNELEPVKRGIYGGAVGYLSWEDNMDMAIAIRTLIIKDEEIYLQAGAGVVAESDPELEWQETLNKGQALIKAIEMAEGGLARL